MADEFKMVVVDGVRYRPEDAPKKTKATDDEATQDASPAEHKMRQPRRASKKSG